MATTPVLPKLVGERVKRREDPRLIQGRGTYVDDIKIAGMQHLAFKRSDVAHGRIRSIDTSAAAAMDGVEAVFTGAQIAEFLAPMPIGTPFPSPPHRAVAIDVVRYAGEPVAVVVATRSLRRARCRRRDRRRLRAAAGGRRSRAGDDRQADGDPPRLRQQPGRGARAERHRRQRRRQHGRRLGHRQGVRRGRGRRSRSG